MVDVAAASLPTLRAWYRRNARDLPWRHDDVTPWQVLISEFMLQQTPVVRVLPVYSQWVARWPTAASLACEPVAVGVQAWGGLGYPRRALRLHASAQLCVTHHNGEVPDTYDGLRELPGVGAYTASAVLAFAYLRRVAVLDTNVRRVLARWHDGQAYEPPGAPRRVEERTALAVLPKPHAVAAHTSAALMELGAVICTARNPDCDNCPLAKTCQWLHQGKPAWAGPVRRGQTYVGTDRQCRGRLLAALRAAPDISRGVTTQTLVNSWPDHTQRERAIDGLLVDGLVEQIGRSRYRLPH